MGAAAVKGAGIKWKLGRCYSTVGFFDVNTVVTPCFCFFAHPCKLCNEGVISFWQGWFWISGAGSRLLGWLFILCIVCIKAWGSGMVESKSIGTFSPLQKQDNHRGLFVDSGVGSPKLVKSASATNFNIHLRLDSETKNAMPTAAGAVAATTVADQMLGPKEDGHLAIVLVGLRARGKSFTVAKITRYLR